MMNTLVTDDGRLIPVIAGIGNYEVFGGRYHWDEHRLREGFPPYHQDNESRARISPYYYTLFAFPGQPGYAVLDFGDYLSLVMLDSDHTNPIEGKQAEWLYQILIDRSHVPHIFPVYHIPAYPSARTPDSPISVNVREHWVSLFEKHGIRVAFENHDHTYKRTYPIKADKIDSEGVVYIGNGAWGVYTREIGARHEDKAFYLKKGTSQRHFVLATIHWRNQHFVVINEDGRIIDEYPSTLHMTIDADQKAQKPGANF